MAEAKISEAAADKAAAAAEAQGSLEEQVQQALQHLFRWDPWGTEQPANYLP